MIRGLRPATIPTLPQQAGRDRKANSAALWSGEMKAGLLSAGFPFRGPDMIDISRIRADTPAAARRAYLHNAGAALMPVQVVEAMKRHIDLEAEIGGYAAADREAERLDRNVYASVAKLLNAAPVEIAADGECDRRLADGLLFPALPRRRSDPDRRGRICRQLCRLSPGGPAHRRQGRGRAQRCQRASSMSRRWSG